MLNYLKAFFMAAISKKTYRNCLFELRLNESVYGKAEKKISQKYGKELHQKLEIAQEIIDTAHAVLPNQKTDEFVAKINASKDKATWNDFNAEVVANKHGNGSNGINLGMNGEIKGVPFSIGKTNRNIADQVQQSLFDI